MHKKCTFLIAGSGNFVIGFWMPMNVTGFCCNKNGKKMGKRSVYSWHFCKQCF